MKRLLCKCPYEKCGHEWLSRGDKEPQSCPKCKYRFVGKKIIVLKEVEI